MRLVYKSLVDGRCITIHCKANCLACFIVCPSIAHLRFFVLVMSNPELRDTMYLFNLHDVSFKVKSENHLRVYDHDQWSSISG